MVKVLYNAYLDMFHYDEEGQKDKQFFLWDRKSLKGNQHYEVTPEIQAAFDAAKEHNIKGWFIWDPKKMQVVKQRG